jgi:hypothetical protein
MQSAAKRLDNICRMLVEDRKSCNVVWREDSAEGPVRGGLAEFTASMREEDHRELGESRVVVAGFVAEPVAEPSLVVIYALDPRLSKRASMPLSEQLHAVSSSGPATATASNASGNTLSSTAAVSTSGAWSLGVNYVRAVSKWMRARKIRHAIIVMEHTASAFVQGAIGRECADLEIELFVQSTFSVHKPSHSLVPRHTALSTAEAADFLKRHFCESKDLEILLHDDAICRW